MKQRESVSHIMSKDLKTVHKKQNLADVNTLMDTFKIRHVPVLDGDSVIGIISRTDLMHVKYGAMKGQEKLQEALLEQMPVEDAMTITPTTISSTLPIQDAGKILHEKDFSALPVVDHGKLVGMLTSTDLIGYLLSQY